MKGISMDETKTLAKEAPTFMVNKAKEANPSGVGQLYRALQQECDPCLQLSL